MSRPITLDDLRDMDACEEALQWVAEQLDMETAWRTCARADWMAWALQHSDADPKRLRLMTADLAEAVLPVWEAQYPKDQRPRKAIQAARALAHEETTEEEARAAAWAAWVAARIAARATGAAWAAAWVAIQAADAAIWAAAWAAVRAAANDAERAAQADIVRRHFPTLPTITETP